MWDMEPKKVLVGVESVGCEAALQYAAAEAVRRGCGVHLVHVARPAVLGSCALDDLALLEDELRKVGDAVLADAADRMEILVRSDERISVSTELTHGSAVHMLVSLSSHAGVAVLQHEGMGEAGESASLSVTAGVAAHAHCPVVAVPDHWRPESGRQCVLVGVEEPAPAREVVRVALAEAARREARLLVVHAWTPARGTTPPAERAETVRREVELADAFADLWAAEPAVQVEVVVETGPASTVLLQRGGRADLAVVGRHHRKHVVGASVGAAVRELLRGSTVPVMVVDPQPGHRSALHVDLATVAIP